MWKQQWFETSDSLPVSFCSVFEKLPLLPEVNLAHGQVCRAGLPGDHG